MRALKFLPLTVTRQARSSGARWLAERARIALLTFNAVVAVGAFVVVVGAFVVVVGAFVVVVGAFVVVVGAFVVVVGAFVVVVAAVAFGGFVAMSCLVPTVSFSGKLGESKLCLPLPSSFPSRALHRLLDSQRAASLGACAPELAGASSSKQFQSLAPVVLPKGAHSFHRHVCLSNQIERSSSQTNAQRSHGCCSV